MSEARSAGSTYAARRVDIREIAERSLATELLDEFTDLPEAVVRRTLSDSLASFEGSAVTTFVPILARRRARKGLRDLRQ
jgi:hypothetical protein